MSRSLAWTPTGPARETYETEILADLEATLKNTELPEGAPLFLKLYMIGRNIDSANPVVMVCCVHRGIRRQAESSIRESRILDRYPGFGLGSSALLLESDDPEELLTEVRSSADIGRVHIILTSFQGYQTGEGALHSNVELNEFSTPVEIYASFPYMLGGNIRFVPNSQEGVFMALAATGGPIFQLDTDLYQITTRHSIPSGHLGKIHYSTSELDECEFDGQSDFDGDSTMSNGSSTSEQFSTQSSDEDSPSPRLSADELSKSDQGMSMKHVPPQIPVEEAPNSDQQSRVVQARQTKIQPHGRFRPLTVQSKRPMEHSVQLYPEFHNPDLDYILLKLPTQISLSGSTPILRPSNFGSRAVTRTSHIGLNSPRVLVMTPDGSIPGRILPETTSYKMRGFTKLQQLLTVELRGVFHKGYSGSAVVDFVTGDVYGQITLGTPGKSLAYCVRAPDVIADIVNRIGHIPILDESQWLMNK